ncbi:MBL fold metallo-hydrolase [Salinisphaera sp. T31B1]|uniref:MBL fold metallo-hydrolase n=1 Tax=Salinisphaera sp. T31B1 TaxID=727963 RepID=UPI0033428AAC
MADPRIHHLNCASMHPVAGFSLEHRGGAFTGLVCHCLLIETTHGLTLVDTGLGTTDVRAGAQRLGRMFWHVVRPALDPRETAKYQIEALGFSVADVRHIVLTHLDVDHAGGIGDFPNARVHVLAAEHAAAQARRHLKERDRYRPAQWPARTEWALYAPEGERWHGFEAVQALTGLDPDILLVPTAGHTRGHAAIAVRQGAGWLLHAGDAYFHRDQMARHAGCPLGLRLFEAAMALDNGQRRTNQARLRELALDDDTVRVFCSHDPVELAQATPPSEIAPAPASNC